MAFTNDERIKYVESSVGSIQHEVAALAKAVAALTDRLDHLHNEPTFMGARAGVGSRFKDIENRVKDAETEINDMGGDFEDRIANLEWGAARGLNAVEVNSRLGRLETGHRTVAEAALKIGLAAQGDEQRITDLENGADFIDRTVGQVIDRLEELEKKGFKLPGDRCAFIYNYEPAYPGENRCKFERHEHMTVADGISHDFKESE